MYDELLIDTRRTDKIGGLTTGNKHIINVKTKFSYSVIEMEDINFHFDSAVLLPDYGPEAPQPGTPDQNRITGLGVLYAIFKFAEKNNYKQKILIAGHTDKKGSKDYNLTLSQLRADNVFHALMGNQKEWADICDKKHQIEDYQQILIWIAYNWGWKCDPGPKTNELNPETKAAIIKFKQQYNKEFNKTLDETSKVDKETWGAFFHIYMEEMKLIMGLDDEGLKNYQTQLQFMHKEKTAAPSVGCGENFPASGTKTEDENPIDRRVEILFFDEAEEPELKCHPKEKVCLHKVCDLYNTTIYTRNPVPVEPLPLPSGQVARIFMKVQYNDPENKAKDFPEGFKITVVFPDKTTQLETVGKEGKLTFQVERKKTSFTFQFDTDNVNYIASPTSESPPGSTETLIFEPEARGKAFDKFRVFKLPKKWSLSNSKWSVANTDTYVDPSFGGINVKRKNIGSEAARAELKLDPHWQYLKFLYYDRWLKTKLNVPPLFIDGFKDSASLSGEPDTRSNWITDTEKSLCIPWIIQKPPKPDGMIQIIFKTSDNTFIEASGTSANFTRRLVTKGNASSQIPADVGINTGDFLDKDFNKPDGNRLAYYDLPKVWRSRTYFTQLSGGTGNPPAKKGKFETLAAEKTEDTKPLLFSLDDIVLTDKDLNPINWKPDNQVLNRTSIFCNTFSRSGPNQNDLSSEGLYKPDGEAFITAASKNTFTSNNLGFFTQLPSSEADRNLIVEYPDWTRLIITQGNFFEVFNKRIPDKEGNIVGARAAVRLVDVFSSKSTFVEPEKKRPRLPAPIKQEGFFCEVQPLFEQDHIIYDQIGRFDMIRLRCCDIDNDGVTELGTAVVFLRLFFNFNAAFKPSFNPNGVPLNITGAAAVNWSQTAIMNFLHRWNGPDSTSGASPKTMNPGAATVQSLDPKVKFKSKVIWFSQDLPKNKSHYEVGVFKDATEKIRGFMRSSDGIGVLDQTDNTAQASGWFTFAHEAGHGGSLVDEYIEQTSPTTFPSASWLPGFDSNSPGSPFSIDDQAMMRSNREVRARHYWYVAEWFRQLDKKGLEYKINHDIFDYTIPHHSDEPRKNHVGWSVAEKKNQELGDHGKFDIFFYPLGKEKYSSQILPGLAKKPGDFDGIIIVLVKIQFDFHINNSTQIHNFLTNIQGRIDLKFNNKFGVKGNAGGKAFTRVLLHFAPRYRANNYSATNPSDTDEHIKVNMKATGPPEWDSGIIFVNKHKLFFPFDVPHVFSKFFGHMVGLTDSSMDKAVNYLSIAKKVIPDANVFDL